MIRLAKPADHAAIAEVNTAAFGQTDEAALVARLRTDDDVLFELVSADEAGVNGHILFSRLWADRWELFAALAPMSVRPDLQRTGLGSALVRTGLEYAKEFGAHGVIVLGHPAYYPRFGFAPETVEKVAAPFAGLPAFMGLALEEGAFDAPFSITYPDAFGVGA